MFNKYLTACFLIVSPALGEIKVDANSEYADFVQYFSSRVHYDLLHDGVDEYYRAIITECGAVDVVTDSDRWRFVSSIRIGNVFVNLPCGMQSKLMPLLLVFMDDSKYASRRNDKLLFKRNILQYDMQKHSHVIPNSGFRATSPYFEELFIQDACKMLYSLNAQEYALDGRSREEWTDACFLYSIKYVYLSIVSTYHISIPRTLIGRRPYIPQEELDALDARLGFENIEYFDNLFDIENDKRDLSIY